MSLETAETYPEQTEAEERGDEIFHRTLQIWFSAWTMISVGAAVATGLTVPEWGWYYGLAIVTGGMVVGMVGGVGVGSALSLKYVSRKEREKPKGSEVTGSKRRVKIGKWQGGT